MFRRIWIPVIIVLAAAAAAGVWWTRRAVSVPASTAEDRRPAAGDASRPFTGRAVGSPIRSEERPQIAHVAVVDLDRDGATDILVCDAFRNVVGWIRQEPRGTFTELLVAEVRAPSHVEAIDFDRDGDLDLLVGALGSLFPNNNRVGSVIVFENDGRQRFRTHHIAEGIARVADARATDLDGDGDLDV